MVVPGDVRFQSASDRTLLVRFGDSIDSQSRTQILRLVRLLQEHPIRGVHNLHPAHSSLLLTFDAHNLTHIDLEAALHGYIARAEGQLPEPQLVEIPVCYGGKHGPDLIEVAQLRGIPTELVAEIHAAAEYVVYFLGFVPGFAYLGEVPDALVTPRLPTPRRSVPPGSVGIAGKQTGVYPFAAPGGWRLIGRTPLPMFDAVTGSRLSIGDRVRFVPISADQYAGLEKEQAKA